MTRRGTSRHWSFAIRPATSGTPLAFRPRLAACTGSTHPMSTVPLARRSPGRSTNRPSIRELPAPYSARRIVVRPSYSQAGTRAAPRRRVARHDSRIDALTATDARPSRTVQTPAIPPPDILMRSFTGPDGTTWRVEVRSPGSSNAMVLFRHPDGSTTRLDRYAWYLNRGSESQDVSARLDRGAVLKSLADADLQRLLRRSMPVSTARTAVG